MMKSISGNLFYLLLLIIAAVLAVLGFVVGQLFPFFADQYHERQLEIMTMQLEQNMANEDYSDSQRQAMYNSLVIPKNNEDQILQEESKRLKLVIVSLYVCGFLLIWIAINGIVRNFAEPIIDVTNAAKELEAGNYRARAFTSGPRLLSDLKNSINKLANNLETITKTQEIEQERLKTLVETMGSGLIMMNREGQIIIANRQFLKSYHMKYEDIIGQSFLTIDLPAPIKEFIDYVFFTEHSERKQISVQVKGDIKYKEIFGAPVIGDHGKWLGVVIVVHDITELFRLEQIRRDFVANVSHELRTPITSIKGFSETLLDGAYKDEAMLLSFLEIMHKESNRLQVLVNDLLELSKLERQGYTIEKTEVDVERVLARVIDVVSQKMDEKQIEVSVELEKKLKVIGEENRLIQIFTNLVNNAIMYSPAESAISIRVSEHGKYGVIEVADQGMGIEKEEINRVFERFYRVDTARSRNSGGTGLGLSIVKHLVELHEGHIEVESEVRKGTTMRVLLPLATFTNS